MLKPKDFHDYQRKAHIHQITHNDSMLWLDMGLGKSCITLTSIDWRMRSNQVKKTLIFGPLRVIHAVWKREAMKWEHLQHLRFNIIHGTEEKRLRQLFSDSDIYLCNYENMAWLSNVLTHYYIGQGKPLPFEMIVYDEVSKVKNAQSQRMKGGKRITQEKIIEMLPSVGKFTYEELKSYGWTDIQIEKTGYANITPEQYIKFTGWAKIVPHFKFRTGLTGTPASNGYYDLHGQFLAVDGGQRLGRSVTDFRTRFFSSDYMGWKYELTPLGKTSIEKNISDIVIKMDSEDYLEIPEMIPNRVMVDLPPSIMEKYREVERELFTRLDDGTEIELFSRTAVSNKCLQFCLSGETEVLTNSGWKMLKNFKDNDLVWDGVEWVNVYGLTCNGYKPVINCDGVFMTTNHKVLTISGWRKAEDAVYGNACGRFDRKDIRLPDGFEQSGDNENKMQKSIVEGSLYLWERVRNYWSKFTKPKQTRYKIMRMPTWGNHSQRNRIAWNDQDQTIHCLDKHEIKMQQSKRQRLFELWRKRNHRLRRMEKVFCKFLERYGFNLQTTSHHRTSGQQSGIQCEKLPLEQSSTTIKQYKSKSVNPNTDRKNNCNTSCEKIWNKTCDNVCQNSERMVGKGSDSSNRFKKVYDLVNAGPRHRFTVRGNTGKIFIVHNCNGSPYIEPEQPKYAKLHKIKLDALESILEEAAGKPVLLAYTFKPDAERIMKRFNKKPSKTNSGFRVVNMTAEKAEDSEKVINEFNEGKIQLLIGHPQSMGHGIDGLQETGHILVWFGLNWSLELHIQMYKRLVRQGQTKSVTMHMILCNDTMDLVVLDALRHKDDTQEGLKRAVDRYRSGALLKDGTINFLDKVI